MIRTPLNSRRFGLAAVSLLVACADGAVDPGQGRGTLIVRADVAAAAVATLVAEVTAADIPTPLIFNIPISGGVASGTITIPAGSNRTVSLRAYDAGGTLTQSGSATLTVQAGANTTVAITLTPLTGDQAIVVTLGSYTITVTPPSPTMAKGGTTQLAASITDWNGNPTTGTVAWATQNPGIATVDATGLVTGAGVGSTKIAATFHGATGTATVGVTP
jgi:Bacterial Ig-like domain (group 2)